VEILERLVRVENRQAESALSRGHGQHPQLRDGATERAIEVYNLVLDEDLDDERTFGRIERLLTAQNAWRELARNYRRMIKRLGATPPAAKKAQLLGLWRKLGDICRRRLHEREAAVAAYEVCAQLAPDDRRYQEVLAETYEVLGAPKLNQAIKAREGAARFFARLRGNGEAHSCAGAPVRQAQNVRPASLHERCLGGHGARHSPRAGVL